jgi:hypothetical protein
VDVRDAAACAEDGSALDHEPVPDRVGDRAIGRVRHGARGQAAHGASNLEIEPDSSAPAPRDALGVRAPEDDAEEGAVPAELVIRLVEIGDPEG